MPFDPSRYTTREGFVSLNGNPQQLRPADPTRVFLQFWTFPTVANVQWTTDPSTLQGVGVSLSDHVRKDEYSWNKAGSLVTREWTVVGQAGELVFWRETVENPPSPSPRK